MFSLRSSPSTLVPCSLRGAVTAEAGMNFAPRRLKAPRPKRVVMPLIYYNIDEAAASIGCSGNGSSGVKEITGNSEGSTMLGSSPSTYAGVFESGCDPAQVRASLNHGSRRLSATPLHHSKYTSGNEHEESEDQDEAPVDAPHLGTAGAFADEGEAECLFEMEGVRDSIPDAETSHIDIVGCNIAEGSDADLISNVNASHDKARASVTASAGHSSNSHKQQAISRETPCISGAGSEKPTAAMIKGVPAPHHIRQPRVIGPGPGTRCVGSGMYRLRLSTSC